MQQGGIGMPVSRRQNGNSRELVSDRDIERKRAVVQFTKSANAIDELGGGALLNTCDKLFGLFTRRSLETNALMDRIAGFSAKHSPWNGNLVDAVETEMHAISSERRALEEAFFELGDIAKRWNLEKARLEAALLESRKEEVEVKELFMQMCSEASQKLTVARDTSVMREGTVNRKVTDLRDHIKELELELFVVNKDKEEGELLNRARYDQLQTELQRSLSVSAAVRRQWMNKLRKVSERKLRKMSCKDPFTQWKETVYHEKRVARCALTLEKSHKRKVTQRVFSEWKAVFLEDSVSKQFQTLQRSQFPERADRLLNSITDDSEGESLPAAFTAWKWCASATAKGRALEHMSQSFSTREADLLKEVELLRSVTDSFTARESEQVQKIEALQSQIDSFTVRECELVQQIEVLKSQTESLTTGEAELLQQMATLQSQTQASSVREAELLEQVTTLQSQTDKSFVREADLLQQVATLQSQTEAFTVREARLLEKVATLQSQTETSCARESDLLQQMATLQTQTDAFTLREAELLQRVAAQTSSCSVREAELLEQVAALESEKGSLSVREAELVQQLERLKARADASATREAELLNETELLKSHAGTAECQPLPEAVVQAVAKETEEDVTCVRSQADHDTNSCTTEEQGNDDAHDSRTLNLQRDASLAILSHDMQFVQEAMKLVLSTIHGEAQQLSAPQAVAADRGEEGWQPAHAEEPGILGLAFDDELIVIDIVAFSPADDCGRIAVGDRLVSISGKEQASSKFTREEAASELFGPAGSVAELVVERADGGREHCTLLRTSKAEVLARWALRKDFETLSQFVGSRAAAEDQEEAAEAAAARGAPGDGEGVLEQLETALELNKELTREREEMSKAASALRVEREQSLRSIVELGENLEQLVEGILEQLESKVVRLGSSAAAAGEAKRGESGGERIADESSILLAEGSYASSRGEPSFCEQSPLKDHASTVAHLAKILKIRSFAVGGEAVSVDGRSAADVILVLVQTLVFVFESATGKKLELHDGFSERKPTIKEAVAELQAVVEGLEMVARHSKSWRRWLRNWMATLKRVFVGLLIGAMMSCYLGQHGLVNMNECSASLPGSLRTLHLQHMRDGLSSLRLEQLRHVDLQHWKAYAHDSLGAAVTSAQDLLHTLSHPEEAQDPARSLSTPAPQVQKPPKTRGKWFSGAGKH